MGSCKKRIERNSTPLATETEIVRGRKYSGEEQKKSWKRWEKRREEKSVRQLHWRLRQKLCEAHVNVSATEKGKGKVGRDGKGKRREEYEKRERIQHNLSAAGLEAVHVEVGEALERLGHEVVHGPPDGPAPVAVTAKHAGRALSCSLVEQESSDDFSRHKGEQAFAVKYFGD